MFIRNYFICACYKQKINIEMDHMFVVDIER